MYPQQSKLYLSTKLGYNNKTIIDNVFFTPPLKILEPFYEDNRANIMLLSVSAGLMAGDNQEIKIHIQKNTELRLCSQSFEKIHDTKEEYAKRNLSIKVENNALFDFDPLPSIPFANSSFYSNGEVFLQKQSKLYYSEIIVAGRVGLGEIFLFKNYTTKLKIFLENQLIFFDNTSFVPSIMNLKSLCYFSTFTHYLSLIIIDDSFNYNKAVDYLENSSIFASITAINGGYCLKALANGSEPLLNLRNQIRNFGS